MTGSTDPGVRKAAAYFTKLDVFDLLADKQAKSFEDGVLDACDQAMRYALHIRVKCCGRINQNCLCCEL